MPSAPLEVLVLRADCTPAEGVEVRVVGRTVRSDRDGVARFESVPVGACTVLAQVHGFTPTAAQVVVGSDRAVTLREAPTRPVAIRVVDGKGRPVPSARVRATSLEVPDGAGGRAKSGCTLAAMDGDVEDLAPRTGADGRLVRHVPEGRVRYDVSLYGAAAAVESDADEVEVVLRAP